MTSGETDLQRLLAGLEVERRAGTFAYVTLPPGAPPPAGLTAAATVVEDEGTTLVVEHEAALAAGLDPVFPCAWLTLRMHSSLEAVGLTAALSRRLASAGIPANILAGYYHDHVLVPVERADDAVAAMTTTS